MLVIVGKEEGPNWTYTSAVFTAVLGQNAEPDLQVLDLRLCPRTC